MNWWFKMLVFWPFSQLWPFQRYLIYLLPKFRTNLSAFVHIPSYTCLAHILASNKVKEASGVRDQCCPCKVRFIWNVNGWGNIPNVRNQNDLIVSNGLWYSWKNYYSTYHFFGPSASSFLLQEEHTPTRKVWNVHTAYSEVQILFQIFSQSMFGQLRGCTEPKGLDLQLWC